MELVCVERARLLRQFFRAALHSLVKLRHQLAVFGRENLQVAAEKAHRLQFFLRESVRRNGCEMATLHRADPRHSRSHASSLPLHHPPPRTPLPTPPPPPHPPHCPPLVLRALTIL